MAKKATHFWIEPDDLARKGMDYCSLEAQGLWLKVMRLLHASERYGHLTRDGKPVSDLQAARRCGVDVQKWIALRDELLEFDLLRLSADGILYSPELVAQAEWRAKSAKRQKDFQKRRRGQKQAETNNEYNDEYNADITPDITPLSQPNSKLKKPSFSSDEKKEGGGGRTPAHANGKPPPAAVSENSNRQWLELTPEEAAMSQTDFAAHLQTLFPTKQVRAVGKKLKRWCADNGKAFCRERLKGWMAGEHEPLDDEFLKAIGADDESPPTKETPEEKRARLAKYFQSVPSTLKKKTKPKKTNDG